MSYCVHGRNVPQFDGTRYEGRNCAVSVARSLIHFGSRGLYLPGPTQTRKRMKNPDRWVTPLEVERAVESYDDEMKRHGLRPLRYRRAGTYRGVYITKGASRSNLAARVRRLEMAHVVIDYRKLNNRFPELSGSPSFMGRHAIWIGGGTKRKPGWRKRNGRIEVRYADPTWGRAGAPRRVPKWVALWKVWKIADGAWSSRGGRGWVGGSVACTKPLPPPPMPEPEPEDECEECETALREAEERIAQLEEQLGEAADLIAILQRKRLPREMIERLVALAAEIEDAYGAIDDGAPLEDGVDTQEGD